MVEAAMGNVRFFSRSGPHRLAVVAEAASGTARELDLLLEGVAPLQAAGPHEVSFLDNRRYASALEHTLAGAVIVHPEMQTRVPAATVPILTTEPLGLGADAEPSLRIPGIIISLIFSEQGKLVLRATPLQN